jgi:hypothetical protein
MQLNVDACVHCGTMSAGLRLGHFGFQARLQSEFAALNSRAVPLGYTGEEIPPYISLAVLPPHNVEGT